MHEKLFTFQVLTQRKCQLWSATIHTDQGTGVCAYAVHGDDKRPSIVLGPLCESLMQASPFLWGSTHHFAPISPWPSNRDHDAKDPMHFAHYFSFPHSPLFCIQIMRVKTTTNWWASWRDLMSKFTGWAQYSDMILSAAQVSNAGTPCAVCTYVCRVLMVSTTQTSRSLWLSLSSGPAKLSWFRVSWRRLRKWHECCWVYESNELRGEVPAWICLELMTLKKCRSYAVIGQFVSR